MPLRISRLLAIGLGVVFFFIFFNIHLRSGLDVPLRPDQRTARQGFYNVERNGEQFFSWTGPHAEFTVPGVDRGTGWRVALDTRIWRPAGVGLPQVRVSVDGVPLAEQMLKGDLLIEVTAPPRPGARGITVSIDTTPAFEPGPRDHRKLGVAITSMRLEPAGGTPAVPLQTIVKGAAAIALLATAVAMLGAAPLGIAAFAVLVAWGEAALLAHGFGPYLQYSTRVLLLAVCLGSLMLAAAWMIARRRRHRLSASAIAVAAICLGACFLKLSMLLHPDMPIGDGVFHAHRFEYVLAGRLYFTSLTPDNYAFPYPVFLYVVSAPFAWLTSDTLERLVLLRVVTTVADASVAALLYWMIVRASSDKLAGIAAVVWYHAIPMTAWIMTEGALTNAFAQTLFVASLALVVALPVELFRRRTVAALTIVATAALLTHPSTCAILAGVLIATSALYAWRGGTLRPAAAGVAIGAVASGVIAVALYYAWFPSVYVSELGRIASASVSPATSEAGSIGSRLARAARLGDIYFGWPAVAVAAVGAWRLGREGSSPRLNLLLLGWACICMVFLVIGILTPVEMRYHFAAFPALAIAAAFACSWAWRSQTAIRVAIAVLVVAGVWDGVSQWMWALTTYARMVR